MKYVFLFVYISSIFKYITSIYFQKTAGLMADYEDLRSREVKIIDLLNICQVGRPILIRVDIEKEVFSSSFFRGIAPQACMFYLFIWLKCCLGSETSQLYYFHQFHQLQRFYERYSSFDKQPCWYILDY